MLENPERPQEFILAEFGCYAGDTTYHIMVQVIQTGSLLKAF